MPIAVLLGAPCAMGGIGLGLRLGAGSIARRSFTSAPIARPLLACRSRPARRDMRSIVRALSTTAARMSEKPEKETQPPPPSPQQQELTESPYTLPNALTLARIASCPVLAWSIVQGNYELATGILVASGLTDWLDGYLARKWNQKSVLGSILDPMADKALVTTLVVCLTYQGLLPLPLAVLIFGRDLALSLWAFYLRFISLPPPRTLRRYFDVSKPSAEVQPTQISKINTALQLLLMGITTVSPLLTAFPAVQTGLHALQWTVAGTTIWSGLSYVGASGFKILKQPGKPKL